MQLKVYNKRRSTCYMNSPPSAQFWPPLRSQEMPGVRQQVQCSTNIQIIPANKNMQVATVTEK